MKERIVISDAGPMISLERIENGFEFIDKIYKEIIVPQSVFNELLIKNEAFYKKRQLSGKLKVVQVQKIENIPNVEKLHTGEIEAISLAFQENLSLLIEEYQGRLSAQKLGVRRMGIGGVILKAVKNKIIGKYEAFEKLDQLYKRSRINEDIYNLLVQEVTKASL